MDFDSVLLLLGDFGKSQKRQYFLLCLPAAFCGFQVIATVFSVASPPARCVVLPSEHLLNVSGSHDGSELHNSSTVHGPTLLPDACYWHENISTSSGSVNVTLVSHKCTIFDYDKSVLGSTIVTEWDLVCDKAGYAAVSSMMYLAGILFGALTLGLLADKIGRKKVFLMSTLLESTFGIASGLAPEYYSFIVFRFIVAFMASGKFSAAYILGMELIGQSKRIVASIVIFYFYALGCILVPGIAYFLRDWRHLLIAGSAPGLLFVSYYWLVQESVRWLLANKHHAEAEAIVRSVAATNGVVLPEHVFEKDSDDKSLIDDSAEKPVADGLMTVVRSRQMLMRTLGVALNWMVASMGYYGLTLNSGNLGGNIYLNTLISGLVEFPAYTVAFTCAKFGRKRPYVAAMALAAVSSLSIVVLSFALGEGLHSWAYMASDMVGKFGISAAFCMAFLWSAEIFPTTLRSSLMGLCSMLARSGALVAPFIADAGKQMGGAMSKSLHAIVFGCLMLLAAIAAMGLPETNNQPLPQTVNDANENAGTRLSKKILKLSEKVEGKEDEAQPLKNC